MSLFWFVFGVWRIASRRLLPIRRASIPKIFERVT